MTRDPFDTDWVALDRKWAEHFGDRTPEAQVHLSLSEADALFRALKLGLGRLDSHELSAYERALEKLEKRYKSGE
jgi:hypothetical protein